MSDLDRDLCRRCKRWADDCECDRPEDQAAIDAQDLLLQTAGECRECQGTGLSNHVRLGGRCRTCGGRGYFRVRKEIKEV